MPELPEVHALAADLDGRLRDRVIDRLVTPRRSAREKAEVGRPNLGGSSMRKAGQTKVVYPA
jgi:formamidopyrimidine-DNA glycosylase